MNNPEQSGYKPDKGSTPADVASDVRPVVVVPAARPRRRAISTLRVRVPARNPAPTPASSHTLLYRGKPRHLVIAAILLTIVITAIMSVPLLPSDIDIEPGMPAPRDIYAPTYVRYESRVLTDHARAEAQADLSNEVWVQDTAIVQRQRATLQRNLSIVDQARQESRDIPGQSGHRAFQGITITEEMLNMLVALPPSDYSYWRDSNVLVAYDAMMRDRRLASEADVANARTDLPNRLLASLSQSQRAAAIAFVSPMISINVRLDEEQTAERRNAAVAAVKPAMQTLQKGEAILRQGEIATPEAIEKMQEAGLLRRDVSAGTVAATAAIVALMMLLLHIYIFRYAPQVWRRQRQIMLIAMLLVVTMAVARLLLPGHNTLPYLMPVAAVSLLIAVLINTNVAVLVTFVLAVLSGMIATGNNLSGDLPLYYFVGGLVGIFTLTKVERVSTYAWAGGAIALSSFIVAFTMRTLAGTPVDWSVLQTFALASLFNGGVSAAIAYAAFSLLGMIFGITTPVQLMELAHPDQPVLRRLMQEAPGTYHHSLVVSNLAERAAEMVGADPLLTRVCAYYHDIGKVLRPSHFIDNQSGMKNIHDEMDPWESAKIIASHVSDGVTLANKHRLPRRVIDAIPQHHGTMLIKYFYHKARQMDPTVNPDDFRYPGPKPQTKENAILMLADGVEATVRAMAQAGALDKLAARNSDASESPDLYNDSATLPEDAIANVVHDIINERIEDGQLDECDLTVRDIARIQEAFVSMLKGIYHPRVQYPDDKQKPTSPATTPTSTPTSTPTRTGAEARPVVTSKL